jgi:serine/threonine-protein kinase
MSDGEHRMQDAPAPLVGTVLAGKYELVRPIGRGGMGAVYEARNRDFGKRCAVKLLLEPDFVHDTNLVGRFLREARTTALVESEHIVEVFDTGIDSATQYPFIVMELLRGEDLEHVASRVGPMAPVGVARLVSQAAVGLVDAHRAGVVHRDVKPANIFLHARTGAGPVVKLLDFGVAKPAIDALGSGSAASLTRTGALVGTPLYMSPEQAQGSKSIDHRTDIWSLSMCLYQLLAGRLPWGGEVDTLGALIVAIAAHPLAPVQSLAPWVPRGLADLVHRGLRREPGDRIASAQALIDGLRPFCAGALELSPEVLVSGRPRGGAVPQVAAVTEALTPPASSSSTGAVSAATGDPVVSPPPSRARAAWIGGAVAGALLLVGASLLVSRGYHAAATASPAQASAASTPPRSGAESLQSAAAPPAVSLVAAPEPAAPSAAAAPEEPNAPSVGSHAPAASEAPKAPAIGSHAPAASEAPKAPAIASGAPAASEALPASRAGSARPAPRPAPSSSARRVKRPDEDRE